MEFNLRGQAGIAVEATYVHRNDDVSKSEAEDTNDDTLQNEGRQAAIFISRYSEASRMAGFYWTLGMGYRSQDVDWEVEPDGADEDIDLSLVQETTGKLRHEATLTGITGHGRLGYRYIGTSVPFIVGGYGGLRHWSVGAQDRLGEDNVANEGVAPLTNQEKGRLNRRFTTRPELGIEIGYAF